MNETLYHLLSAFAFILVIEGLLYAIFPDTVKRMMAMAISMDREKLSRMGAAMALIGVIGAWTLQQLH